jgi:hypothetical protein
MIVRKAVVSGSFEVTLGDSNRASTSGRDEYRSVERTSSLAESVREGFLSAFNEISASRQWGIARSVLIIADCVSRCHKDYDGGLRLGRYTFVSGTFIPPPSYAWIKGPRGAFEKTGVGRSNARCINNYVPVLFHAAHGQVQRTRFQ